MKRLLLLRHAKSDWSSALPDHQRQLNLRGQQAAARMGRYIADEDLNPDKVLCSPATRATETWRLVQQSLSADLEACYLDAIYDFGSGTSLLDVLREHGGDAQTLMLIGHNPSIEGLAGLLSGTGDETALASLARKYPTAGLAVIDFEFADWQEVNSGSGNLQRFVRPKELAD